MRAHDFELVAEAAQVADEVGNDLPVRLNPGGFSYGSAGASPGYLPEAGVTVAVLSARLVARMALLPLA